MYLKSKGVEDTNHHVVINVLDTRSEEGIVLNVTIKNYNKEKDI